MAIIGFIFVLNWLNNLTAIQAGYARAKKDGNQIKRKGKRDDRRRCNNSDPFALSGLYNGFNHGDVEEEMSNLKSIRMLVAEFRDPNRGPIHSDLRCADELEQLCDEWEAEIGNPDFKQYTISREVVCQQILGAKENKGCDGRSGCKNPPSGEIHPCPYNSDVNNDDSDVCFCCEACQQECADDI